MSKKLCTRGEPEIVFSFDDKGEIIFDVELSTVNGWRLVPFQTPCKVLHLILIIIKLVLF